MTIKLSITEWDETVPAYAGAATEETGFLHYRIVHGFDAPAECWITIKDDDGTKAQKYGITSGDIYIGVAYVDVEDPSPTDLFIGRLMSATANTATRTVELYCQDWLSQLNDTQIDYDMRENLDGAGLRESKLRSDPDGAYVGPVQNDAGDYYLYDDGAYDDPGGMGWANDQFNSKYILFTNEMAGKRTWRFYPYQGSTTDFDNTIAEDNGIEDVWNIDGNKHFCTDVGDYETVYDFRIELGHNTPSDFYVHDSISGARLGVHYKVGDTAGNHVHAEIANTGGGQIIVGQMAIADDYQTKTFPVWKSLVDNVVAADGTLEVTFNCDRTGGNMNLYIDSVWIEVDVETTGYSTATAITATIAPNKLQTATDFTAAATQLWEGVPYCIAKEIYLHIEAATGPVLGYDSMITLTADTADIENTAGISTRQYIKKTPLEILQDLARQDKAHFWLVRGALTFVWESVFDEAVADETLTDADVNSWTSIMNIASVANKAYVQGMRIGDNILESDYTDATSVNTYHSTRTRTIQDVGLVSEYDTLVRATATVNQYKDVQRILTATIRGNVFLTSHPKTLALGYEIQVTSTYFGITDAWYMPQRIEYDTRTNLSTVVLHPRVSAIGLQKDEKFSTELELAKYRRGGADGYIPKPATDTIA